MKKNNAKRTVVVIALIALMAIPSMFAYFTDMTETKENVFTVGNVNIDLTEEDWDDTGKTDAASIVPNQTIAKDPTVSLKGNSEDAYVFMKVVVPVDAAGNEMLDYTATLDTANWTLVNDTTLPEHTYVYAYNKAFSSSDVDSATLFTEVTVKDIDAATMGSTDKTMFITAYALQEEGYSDTADTNETRWDAVKNLTVKVD